MQSIEPGDAVLDAPGPAPARDAASAPRPRGPLGAVRVAVVEDVRGFDALEPEWNALLERSGATVFQSFEWQRTWWRHFGERRRRARLHLVTVRMGDELVAIAPLHVDRVPSLGTLRRLLFIGHRDSDYLDVLVAPGREAECAELLAGHLAEQAWRFDVAVLEEIPERSRLGPLLQEAFLRLGWSSTRRVEEQCPRTALRGSWEETVQSFSPDHRADIRRRLRRIDKAYRIEHEVVPPGPEVATAMRELVAMHQERWGRAGYWGAFADPRRVAFHCELAERMSRRGWLYLAFLRANGERCAANYGFAFRDELSYFLGGARADPELSRYSPSRVLHAKSMQWAIAQGATIYDFLRGNEPYKYQFEASDVPNWTIVAYPRRPRLTAARRRVSAALGTLRRRTHREAQVLVAASREAGWLSRPVFRQLALATRRGVNDVRRVVGGRGRDESQGS